MCVHIYVQDTNSDEVVYLGIIQIYSWLKVKELMNVRKRMRYEV